MMNGLIFVLLFATQFSCVFIANAQQEDIGDEGCPRGAFRFDDLCFSLNFMKARYDEGENYCEAEGGTLIKWKDKKTDYIAQRIRIHHFLRDFWIGLNDQKQEEKWVFGDGTDLGRDFAAWDKREPNNFNDEDCVKMKAWEGYRWDDIKCQTRIFYICQFPGSGCRNGEKSVFGSDCFELNYKIASYSDAENSCKSKGGYLASIKSQEIFDFIKKLIRIDTSWKLIPEEDISSIIGSDKQSFKRTWVGIRLVNNKWVYSDGTEAGKYRNWNPGEPNHYTSEEECATVVLEKWYDANCNEIERFICQFQFNSSLSTSGNQKTKTSLISLPKKESLTSVSSSSRWSNSQLTGLFFGGLILGISAPVLIWLFVQNFSKIKKKFLPKTYSQQNLNMIEAEA